jgi:hypothetical protein
LLARLPRHSHYRAAIDDADDYAAVAVQLGTHTATATSRTVPLAGYDDVVARLDHVYDAVNAVNETLLAVYSAKKTRVRPVRAPRPETAYQRLLRQQKTQKLSSIVDRMTGGK